uniref:Uncharacterized protein n=1 Tax=Sphaerodactylus townsendi TaxID=933632 RepID=A0ACB8FGF3_9SAUR
MTDRVDEQSCHHGDPHPRQRETPGGSRRMTGWSRQKGAVQAGAGWPEPDGLGSWESWENGSLAHLLLEAKLQRPIRGLWPQLKEAARPFTWFFATSPQDLQQVMVSGPNLNETSIVSGGYGGTAEGIIPTSSIKGPLISPVLPASQIAVPGLLSLAKLQAPLVLLPARLLIDAGGWDRCREVRCGQEVGGINTHKCTKQLLSSC